MHTYIHVCIDKCDKRTYCVRVVGGYNSTTGYNVWLFYSIGANCSMYTGEDDGF